MRSWLVVSLSLVVAGFAAPIFAEDAPKKEERKGRPGREEIMKKLDTNGDGKVDDAERAKAREEFTKRLDSGELPPMLLKRFDANEDGKLDDAEKAKAKESFGNRRGGRGQGGDRQLPEAVVKKFDANGDGKLDDAEKAKAREEFQKRRGEGRGKKKAE